MGSATVDKKAAKKVRFETLKTRQASLFVAFETYLV